MALEPITIDTNTTLEVVSKYKELSFEYSIIAE